MGIIEEAKELLSETRYRIKLHDLVAAQVREVIPRLSDEQFSSKENWSGQEFVERLKKYEEITSDLCRIQALLAYWGTDSNRVTLALPMKQICSRLKSVSGVTSWIGLRWYPALLLLYIGGIAAVAAEKYDNLRTLLQASIPDPEHSSDRVTLIRSISNALQDFKDAFKIIPGHERNYNPESEYLFKLLKPKIEDLLFWGDEYESHFDRFEVLFALEHAEQYASEEFGRLWGPVGRFGWKFKRGPSDPFHQVLSEAEAQGDSWPPIVAGLFKGSSSRFKEIATEYSQLVARLGWW
jgi:hypothetical protein